MEYFKAIFSFVCNDKNKTNAMLLQAAKDVLCGMAGDAGFESFEENEAGGINGYVIKQSFDKQTLDDLISFFPLDGIKISYTLEDAEYKNWNKQWEDEGFEPIEINGKCVIHDTKHQVKNAESDDVLDITIDAKLAFGTGTHETTYMIVSELLESDLNNKTVFDCGCGTGILSIVASKLGAQGVMAYDIDEWSVKNTMHNAQINNATNINVMQGNSDILKQIDMKFDVILANINRNILLSDMPVFASKMSSGATLILSGFYSEDAKLIIDKANELNLTLTSQKERNDWCMVKLRNDRK